MNKAEQLKTITDATRRRQLIILDEFSNVWELTKDDHDFPRRLLKYYNILNEFDEYTQAITESDILKLIVKYFDIKPKRE